MKMPQLPWTGGCRCGRVRFEVSAAPSITAACHCRGCQRMTASAFSTTLTLRPDGFAVTAGKTEIGGTHGGRANGEHHHCGWCKSWLFTCLPPGMDAVNVRATMLDDASWFAPFMETQTAEALPWAKTGAPRSYPRFPDPSEYPQLMADFAAA